MAEKQKKASDKNTPSTNRPITVQELKQLIQSKQLSNITLPNGFDKMIRFVQPFVQADEVQYLIDLANASRGKCYELIYDDRSPETQKYYQLIDIANIDMMIQAIIRVYGNQILPESLQNWSPVFDLQWQMRATALMNGKQSGWDTNKFWVDTYNSFVKPRLEGKTVLETLNGEIVLPIKARSIQDIEIIHRDDSLQIRDHDGLHIFDWKELDAFWDNRGNKPNHLADILSDLSNDLDGCLNSEPSVLYTQFAKTNNEPNKQISKLSRALDTLIFIENDRDQSSSRRWFRRDTKHRDYRWYPRFFTKKNPMAKAMKDAHKILEEGGTTQDVAKKYIEDNSLKYEPELRPYSMKKARIQNQYEDFPE